MSPDDPTTGDAPDLDSGRDSGLDSGLDSGEAHRYFRELEDFFIDLRGAPLHLSPSDYQVAKKWYQRGIPLDHVRRVVEEVFAKRRERDADGPPVTLRYFRRPVENAWKQVEEMQAAGERTAAPAFDLRGRLRSLAAALPAALPDRETLADRITALTGDTEHVEATLSTLDREMLSAAAAALDGAAREAIDQQVEDTVSTLFGRLFAGDVDKARTRLHRQILRRHLDLPVLSLFSPEAERGEPSESP